MATEGITRDKLGEHCARINGLAATTEEVFEDELDLAPPPRMMGKAVEGLEAL